MDSARRQQPYLRASNHTIPGLACSPPGGADSITHRITDCVTDVGTNPKPDPVTVCITDAGTHCQPNRCRPEDGPAVARRRFCQRRHRRSNS